MLSESSKWEMVFVHYIAKFPITRFIILKFECTPRPLKLLSHFLPLRSGFICNLNLPPKPAQYQADMADISHLFLVFVIGIQVQVG